MSQNPVSLKVDTTIKGIIYLTLPISLAKLIPELNYLFNAAFLGHLGSKELALAGITGVYYLVFSSIGYGLNNALLSIMSRRAGENNRNAIFAILWHGIVLSWIMATLFVVITWFSAVPLMRWAGIEEGSLSIAGSFLNIRIVGLFFLYALQMQNAFLISIQKSRLLITIAIIQSVSNVILDVGLIFGHFGLPALGFDGAAIASVISELIGMITVTLVIYFLGIKKNYGIQARFSIQLKRLKLILKQGYPLMAQLAISTGSWWVFFVLISRNFDYNGQAVSQTMRNLFGLGGVFSFAFGVSANTMISNLIGQKREDEMFTIMKKLVTVSIIGMGSFVLILNLFPDMFFKIFGQSGEFVEIGKGPMKVVSLALLLVCFGSIWFNAIIATGKTLLAFWIELLGIAVYLTFVWFTIETYKMPLEVAWMAEWAYWITLFTPSFLYLKYGNWRKNLRF